MRCELTLGLSDVKSWRLRCYRRADEEEAWLAERVRLRVLDPLADEQSPLAHGRDVLAEGDAQPGGLPVRHGEQGCGLCRTAPQPRRGSRYGANVSDMTLRTDFPAAGRG